MVGFEFEMEWDGCGVVEGVVVDYVVLFDRLLGGWIVKSEVGGCVVGVGDDDFVVVDL